MIESVSVAVPAISIELPRIGWTTMFGCIWSICNYSILSLSEQQKVMWVSKKISCIVCFLLALWVKIFGLTVICAPYPSLAQFCLHHSLWAWQPPWFFCAVIFTRCVLLVPLHTFINLIVLNFKLVSTNKIGNSSGWWRPSCWKDVASGKMLKCIPWIVKERRGGKEAGFLNHPNADNHFLIILGEDGHSKGLCGCQSCNHDYLFSSVCLRLKQSSSFNLHCKFPTSLML